MADLIDRQEVIKHIEKTRQDALMMDDLREASLTMYSMCLLEEAMRSQPPAQQKKLKYSGESICISCQTKDCDGCLFEPMEGV